MSAEGIKSPPEDEIARLEARVAELEQELRDRAAESARLRAEERRYRLLVEHAADGLVVHDDDGRFLEVNERACDLLGYSRDELLTMSLRDVEPDFDAHGVSARLRELVPGEPITVEGRPRRRDGVPIVVEVRVGLLDDRGGRRRYIAFLRDIGDRTETLRALRESTERFRKLLDEARAELLHVERFATLGTLAAGVGHELNNLAHVLTINLALLRRGAERGEVPDPRSLGDVERAAGHVIAHAKQLLSFGRPGPDHAAPIDLREVVRETVAMMRHVGKLRHVAVALDLPEEPVTVTVSRVRIEQVLINLLANAGEAFIQAGMADGSVTVALELAGARVRCSVKDDGPGMTADALERIFEPYFTTKGHKGTGLGLTVVRRIVQDYGGDVAVHSRPHHGTTFTFDLPLAEGAP